MLILLRLIRVRLILMVRRLRERLDAVLTLGRQRRLSVVRLTTVLADLRLGSTIMLLSCLYCVRPLRAPV